MKVNLTYFLSFYSALGLNQDQWFAVAVGFRQEREHCLPMVCWLQPSSGNSQFQLEETYSVE